MYEKGVLLFTNNNLFCITFVPNFIGRVKWDK